MKKYVVSKVCGFVMIESVDTMYLYDEDGDVCEPYSDSFVFDTLEEAEEEYDIMMEEQNCWLLIKNSAESTFRVTEYIDGPVELYLEADEEVLGVYYYRSAAEKQLAGYRKQVSRYVIVGNKNTGELREFLYTGGPISAYMYEDEERVRMSNVSAPDLYEKCQGWTNKWKNFYNSKFV